MNEGGYFDLEIDQKIDSLAEKYGIKVPQKYGSSTSNRYTDQSTEIRIKVTEIRIKVSKTNISSAKNIVE